ncbi:hypothetical protein BGX27_003529 [Mortierella sp. AM989]|nr:hypothetical protein BGX27_003529 [Mortierella sp. AM989]
MMQTQYTLLIGLLLVIAVVMAAPAHKPCSLEYRIVGQQRRSTGSQSGSQSGEAVEIGPHGGNPPVKNLEIEPLAYVPGMSNVRDEETGFTADSLSNSEALRTHENEAIFTIDALLNSESPKLHH